MRDYNYRKKHHKKEMKRKKFLSGETGYWPTMPYETEDDDGNVYFIDSSTSCGRPHLKRESNKVLRQLPLDRIADGSGYKKHYDLWWNWF